MKSSLHLILALGCAILIYFLKMESAEFSTSVLVFICGALLSQFFAFKFRFHFILLTGLISTFILLSFWQGLLFLLISAAWLSISLLNIKVRWRLFLLLLFFLSLLVWRHFSTSNENAMTLVPVIGALFMFRTFSFLAAISQNHFKVDWKTAAAYFLIAPNLSLFFFPIVDFRRFQDEQIDQKLALQNGASWILSGLIQLLFFRAAQASFFISFEVVTSFGEFAQHLASCLLMYTRISGAFHIVVGAICLYRIDLPVAHNFYLFSGNYAELFKRLNSNWNQFLMTNVFYHSFLKIRKKFPHYALTLSIGIVFAVSFFLHSYSNIWIHGDADLKPQDFIFWGFVFILVAKSLKLTPELNANGSQFFRNFVAITVCIFSFSLIWSIWIVDEINQYAATFLLMKWRSGEGLYWILFFPLVGFLGAIYKSDQCLHLSKRFSPIQLPFKIVLLVATTFVLFSPLDWKPDSNLSWIIRSMKNPPIADDENSRITGRDYYQNMQSKYETQTSEADLPVSRQPSKIEVDDYRRYTWKPHIETYFLGHSIKTNSFGMLDDEYPVEKPVGTYRAALMAACFGMAYANPFGTDWPTLAEKQIRNSTLPQFELLNFSVEGHTPQVFPFVFETQIARFKPDVLMVAGSMVDYQLLGESLSLSLRLGFSIPYPEIRELAGVSDPGSFLARNYKYEPPKEIEYAIWEWSMKKLFAQAQNISAQAIFVMTPTVRVNVSPSEIANGKALEEKQIQTAKTIGFEIIDLRPAFENRDPEEVSHMDDLRFYNHLSVTGHKLMTDKFISDFMLLLKKHEPN